MSSAIWITGPPASGKSVLARAAALALRATGQPVKVLELDQIREVLTPSPTHTGIERDVVHRALVYMAAALAAAGTPVIIDATAHRRTWRELARRVIPRFAEVQLVDARAVAPETPYEPSLHPEVTVDVRSEELDVTVDRVVALVRALAEPGARHGDAHPAAWAIWVTGLPGSGKTTLSRRTAEALAARATRVRVLEFAEVRRMLLDDGPESDATAEIVHRALAYTAKLLTDAGVPVIVDATAPRRAWRRLARELITYFAEVQLVCPNEVCGERERAGRWHLGSGWSTLPCESRAAAPDMVLGYEWALDPELALRTDGLALPANVDALLSLAERLQRTAASGGLAPRSAVAS